ncbi:PurM, N-terminal-like protein [Ochromonadaceae sp. CCMP2298]|nr:PurM, N-terminal-like protein [Ochromonadaceae sp. CCMP2298]
MELWGAEYQENDAFLVNPQDLPTVQRIATRENCLVSAVGTVTDSGSVVAVAADGSTPFNLPLQLVLGKMPQKEGCKARRGAREGFKAFGPDVAVLAQTHFSITGVAVAVGEQPIKGLISHPAQARMTVCEALQNLAFADITSLADVKSSCNWMWAAKLPGEGANMYAACRALRDCMVLLGVGVDGGKDSLSMAAKVGGETVKSPGEITLTVYAPCRDVRNTITPDFKYPGEGLIVYVDLGNCGIDVTLCEAWHTKSDTAKSDTMPTWAPLLFGEELGYVFEVLPKDLLAVQAAFKKGGGYSNPFSRLRGQGNGGGVERADG